MNLALRQRMTVEPFLDWEARQELLMGRDVLAMPGIGLSLPLAELYAGVEVAA